MYNQESFLGSIPFSATKSKYYKIVYCATTVKPPYILGYKGNKVSFFIAGWRAEDAHLAHNQEYVGSNPTPATSYYSYFNIN